jgi:hypothetical protein
MLRLSARMRYGGFLRCQHVLDRATSVVNVNVVNKERKTPAYTGVYLGSCKLIVSLGFVSYRFSLVGPLVYV